MIISTRVRYISGKDLNDVLNAINQLPFKIEHKQTVFAKNRFYFIFVLPENEGIKMNNIDL